MLHSHLSTVHTVPELHLDLSALQSPVLHGFPLQALSCTCTCLKNSSLQVLILDLLLNYRNLSTHWGPSFTWTCLHYRDLWCTGTCLLTGPWASPVVSTLQIPVLHLDLFPPTGGLAGPGHVVSTLQSPVLHLDVFIWQGPEFAPGHVYTSWCFASIVDFT